MSYNIGIVFITLFITSCASKKSEILTFKSTDSKMVIRVSGTKPNALDPWNTNIELEIYGRKSAKGIEYYSRKLDYTTVQCSWEDAHSCVLTFEQQDDTKRLFFIEGSESGYTFKDISDVQ